jgi:hypothetical protein
MSILNNLTNLKRDLSTNFSSDILGMKNAIKNFVIAKKGEADQVDKGKVGIIKGIVNKHSK